MAEDIGGGDDQEDAKDDKEAAEDAKADDGGKLVTRRLPFSLLVIPFLIIVVVPPAQQAPSSSTILRSRSETTVCQQPATHTSRYVLRPLPSLSFLSCSWYFVRVRGGSLAIKWFGSAMMHHLQRCPVRGS